MTPHIRFNNFTIDNVSYSSGVFSGDNFQRGFTYKGRKYEGNGSIIGDRNVIINNKHVIKKNQYKQEHP
ncbi:hypothetical protein [Bacillus sp. Marseille-Q3570]|uniref:hypothetical protein n=1 Tax=Bacillus sp. Marseille-Q3570 TaxID=2963522 RepID=UPI0021B6F032|nr:hypothetical protein [Bacillus sp. Marseille-Q3570]